MKVEEYCELHKQRDFLNDEQRIMFTKYLYIGNPYSKEDCDLRIKYVEKCEKEIQEITRKLDKEESK